MRSFSIILGLIVLSLGALSLLRYCSEPAASDPGCQPMPRPASVGTNVSVHHYKLALQLAEDECYEERAAELDAELALKAMRDGPYARHLR